eukprot:7878666-Pyramimonas_sp.AAC.1
MDNGDDPTAQGSGEMDEGDDPAVAEGSGTSSEEGAEGARGVISLPVVRVGQGTLAAGDESYDFSDGDGDEEDSEDRRMGDRTEAPAAESLDVQSRDGLTKEGIRPRPPLPRRHTEE